MRDGVRLDTSIWLPEGGDAAPAILLRTPYKESVMGFKRLGVMRYVEAGYSLVIQQVRGIGASEGHFAFNAPTEPFDGYDTVEWIAAQPWCTGAVGMDGSSYVAMTQLTAAKARPPHLRCIIPAVPSVDFFAEVPYRGGVFTRQHSLNWSRLIQIESLKELTGGFMSTMPVLSQPQVLQRLMSRPLKQAASGSLQGDFLRHYLEPLDHPTFDDWWRARTLGPDDYAAMDLPMMVVGGNFDLGVGTITLWKGLESHAQNPELRSLLIGPWDHGQCYAGGADRWGPYCFGGQATSDLAALRLAFFDRHLKNKGPGASLPGRVTLFVTGENQWRSFDRYPPREVVWQSWFLNSGGRANSARGDGALERTPPACSQMPDRFIDDPELPFVAALAAARESDDLVDLRERCNHHETLVYRTSELGIPVTLLGEPAADLWVAADASDADIVLWLAEVRADGRVVRLAHGQLRLRYHQGFEREVLLKPDVPVRVQVPLTYVAHRLPVDSRLALLISGSDFPTSDPNPHTGEPVATAIACRPAVQTVFHDREMPSSLCLPLLP
jgi:uncharacterized protein